MNWRAMMKRTALRHPANSRASFFVGIRIFYLLCVPPIG
jgi:hypothetical protein